MQPYLNRVELMSNLAVKPEMSLNAKGRMYCNFSLRMVYHDGRGNPIVDFVNVTCYDVAAEMVVRDCGVGDLIMVVGYLTMGRWEQNENIYSKLVVIADSVQLLAVNGGMPPLDSGDVGRYPYKGFLEENEHQYISSYSTDRTRPDNKAPDRNLYPQPMGDGTWKMPISGNAPTMAFLGQHPEVMQRAQSPVSPDADIDIKVASRLLSENLPVRMVKGQRVVFKPDGHYISEQQYTNTINKQRKYLAEMPVEQRLRVLAIAERRFGYVSLMNNNLPAVATDEEIANALAATDTGNMESFTPQRMQFADQFVNTSEGLGDNEDDWWQDEKGTWHLKGEADAVKNTGEELK